jgi:hypothetical protein
MSTIECILICIRHRGDEEGTYPHHTCFPHFQFIIRNNGSNCYYKNLDVNDSGSLLNSTNFLIECKDALQKVLKEKLKKDSVIIWDFCLTCPKTSHEYKEVFTEEFQTKFKKYLLTDIFLNASMNNNNLMIVKKLINSSWSRLQPQGLINSSWSRLQPQGLINSSWSRLQPQGLINSSWSRLQQQGLINSPSIDVNLKNSSGWTALMCASLYGQKKIVDFLLKAGADPNLKNNNGYTALDNSFTIGYINVVKTLIKAGSNINLKNCNDKCLIMVPSWDGHKKIKKLCTCAIIFVPFLYKGVNSYKNKMPYILPYDIIREFHSWI